MSTPTLRLAASGLTLLTVFLAACDRSGTDPGEAGLEREAFIATYVDLRAVALQEGAPGLTDAERQEVLDRHHVTEEQLLEFVEVHGGDVPFMRETWDEIEARLDARRTESPPDEGR